MKNVLLTTTALVAFAGAAAADVAFSGDAEVGYSDDLGGFYADGSIDITATAELNNGISVELTYGLNIYSDQDENFSEFGGDNFPTIVISSAFGTLSAGDIEYAAVSHYAGVSGMDNDGFNEVDDQFVVRADVSVGGFDVSISADAANEQFGGDLDNLELGVSGSMGSVDFGFGYDDTASLFGFGVGTSFGGVDLDFAYADNNGTTSTGVAASMDVTSGVTVGVYYAMNDGDDSNYGVSVDFAAGGANVAVAYDTDESGNSELGIDVDYDAGNGTMVYAGYNDLSDGYYVGATYDLGNGAELGASYADFVGITGDEIGANDYTNGISVWMSLSF